MSFAATQLVTTDPVGKYKYFYLGDDLRRTSDFLGLDLLGLFRPAASRRLTDFLTTTASFVFLLTMVAPWIVVKQLTHLPSLS